MSNSGETISLKTLYSIVNNFIKDDHFEYKNIKTNKLCVGKSCITEEELENILKPKTNNNLCIGKSCLTEEHIKNILNPKTNNNLCIDDVCLTRDIINNVKSGTFDNLNTKNLTIGSANNIFKISSQNNPTSKGSEILFENDKGKFYLYVDDDGNSGFVMRDKDNKLYKFTI